MNTVPTGATKVSDIMTMGVATIRENDTVQRAIELLVEHRISALPVIGDTGKLTGILTDADFLHLNGFHLAEVLPKPHAERRQELESRLVRDIMTHACVTIGPDTPLDDAIDVMDRRGLKRLPVVAEGKLVGLLSRSDLLRALVEYKR